MWQYVSFYALTVFTNESSLSLSSTCTYLQFPRVSLSQNCAPGTDSYSDDHNRGAHFQQLPVPVTQTMHLERSTPTTFLWIYHLFSNTRYWEKIYVVGNPSQAGCDCQGGVVFPPWQDPWVDGAGTTSEGTRSRCATAPSCSTEVRVYPITAAGRGSGGAFCAHVSV